MNKMAILQPGSMEESHAEFFIYRITFGFILIIGTQDNIIQWSRMKEFEELFASMKSFSAHHGSIICLFHNSFVGFLLLLD